MSEFIYDLSNDPGFDNYAKPDYQIPVEYRDVTIAMVNIDSSGMVRMELPDDLIHRLNAGTAQMVVLSLPPTLSSEENVVTVFHISDQNPTPHD